jgi:hypothetical protein
MKAIFKEYQTLKKNVGLAEREILALKYKYYFEKPSVSGFSTIVYPADSTNRLTPPSPLPCQVRHGNRVTSTREHV